MTEKKEVEDYLKLYCLEECLDEIMNNIVTERPTNPYMEVARLFEAKTLPEIMDIEFKPVLIGSNIGVRAVITTNISLFFGIAPYNNMNPNEEIGFKDYTILNNKVKDAILDVDPTNLSKLDENIAKLSGIDQAESLALSIACCRAGARHKGMKLYQYLASLTGVKEDNMSIPIPVVPVLSRIIEGDNVCTQDILLYPINAKSFSIALEKLIQAQSIITKNDSVKKPIVRSAIGCPSITGNNINMAAKIVYSLLKDTGLNEDLKLGINFRADCLLKQPFDAASPNYLYCLDGLAAAPRNGTETIEQMITLWQEFEITSMENPVDARDKASISLLQKRVQETTYELKASSNGTLAYAMGGIGSDSNCSLQYFLDSSSFMSIENFEQFAQETPYNTVKIQLNTFSNLSGVFNVIKKAKSVKWPIILSCADTNNNSIETTDTILADLSVGAGVKQLLAGSLLGEEFASKYNRILEILEDNPNITYVANNFRI